MTINKSKTFRGIMILARKTNAIAARRCVFALTIALLAISSAAAQKANVVYLEGTAKIKSSSGSLRMADFGSTVTYGESVITGKDGLVEMTLTNGSTVRVSQDSVFTYSETGTGTNSRPVLATLAGSVSYKLNKSAGRSPIIQTNSMVAGVRGTEFTVYAGRDGSTLLAVTGGIVDVTSQGETVSLFQDEAVEVDPGKAPGAKYVWLGKELDFSGWNTQKHDDFLADPVAGIERVDAQLAEYAQALADLKGPYEETTAIWEKAVADYKALLAKTSDKDTLQAFRLETLNPAQDARATVILDIRYWALNYLSVRRYVLSNMYMEIKSRNPGAHSAEEDTFFSKHAQILAKYESGIVPELNGNDY